MHSLYARANNVFAFFVSVSFAVMACVALTSPYLLYNIVPDVSIAAKDIQVKTGRIGYYYDYKAPVSEMGNVHFDLEADLTPLFNWNTKQLFVYVVVEYVTPKHSLNQIVIWDDIISTVDDAVLSYKNKKAKYWASDLSHKIAGINGNLTLRWNYVPWVGLMMDDGAVSSTTSFVFPKASK